MQETRQTYGKEIQCNIGVREAALSLHREMLPHSNNYATGFGTGEALLRPYMIPSQ